MLLALGLFITAAGPVTAARYPSRFQWRTFRSGDVEVYYPVGYARYARFLAFSGHAYLDSLDTWYGIRPHRSRIVLNPEMDHSHAMALIGPTRVELPLAPVLDKGLRPQSALYLDRVTGHELTHVVQLSTRHRITRALGAVFGESVAPLALAPDWLLEGQAVWTESSRDGGRLNSSYQSMLMRTELAQAGGFWALDRIAVPGTVNPPPGRAYTGGAFLFGSLASEFRAYERLADWMRKQAAYPAFTGFSFRRAYNDRSLSDQYVALEQAWRAQLRERMKRLYDAGYAVGKPLLKEDRTSYRHPAWGVEGGLVVAETSYDRPRRLLGLSGPMLGRDRDLGDRGYTAHDGVAPFLNGVIVSEIRRARRVPQETRSVLVLVTADGRTTDLKPGGLDGWAPAFHARTRKLAYIAPAAGGGFALRTVPLSVRGNVSGEATDLLATTLGSISDPAWSNDGTRLAFAADLGNGERVYVLDVRDGSLMRVAIEGADATWDPAFSSRGTLWVSADVAGVFDLFEVDLERSTALRRTRVLTGAFEPAPAQDGKRVAYAHYTREGFNLALLDSTRWANEPAELTVGDAAISEFTAADTLLAPDVFGMETTYSPLRHLAPNYAIPSLRHGDEYTLGASVYGRDPVGLLSWRVTGRFGFESGMAELGAALTYRGLPVDLTASAYSYPDRLTEYRGVYRNGQLQEPRPVSTWQRETDLALTAHQPFHFDRGPWRSALQPFAGVVTRYRHRQRSIATGLEAMDYTGVRAGATWYRSYGAARDPVPRHYTAAWLNAEFALPGFDLDARVIELAGRHHLPGPWKLTVVSAKGALWLRDGDLDFSRRNVLPRGFADGDLPRSLRSRGQIVFGGAGFHFPIAFTDRGIPPFGIGFLERITGELFAEGCTGFGAGRTVGRWLEKDAVGSAGAELGFNGWLLYQAQVRLALGAALRMGPDDLAVYVSLSSPELAGYLGEYSPRLW